MYPSSLNKLGVYHEKKPYSKLDFDIYEVYIILNKKIDLQIIQFEIA